MLLRSSTPPRLAASFLSFVALVPLVASAAPMAFGLPVRLTAVRNAYPTPSPDGSQILFQSDRTGRWELYLMKVDGSELRQLTHRAGDNVTPAWSPDGRRIAFAAAPEPGNSEIFLMNADGSDIRRLTDHPGDDSHPHFSPDGRIFFNSPRDTPDPTAAWSRQWHEIYSLTVDGSDPRKHTDCRTVCTFPAPSPDGRRLAYRKIVATPGFNWDLSAIARNSEVFVADLDGTHEVNVSSSAAFDGWPAWSPDGAWIVFASNREGPANVGQVWAARPDGTDAVRLTAGPWSHVQPALSADGKRLYAYRHQEDEAPEFGDIARFERAP